MNAAGRRFAAVLVFAVLGMSVFAAGPSSARAATDVMIVFDTTGSMGKPLTEAKMEIQEAMAQLSASLPDVRFGLAEVSDYNEVNNNGAFSYGIGGGHDAWTLHTGITPNSDLVTAALLKLEAAGGGDGPEAYGRALYEADTSAAVGWRVGARGLIILVADNIPHDNDINKDIPADKQVGPSPYDTGVDPGPDNTVGTGDDLDFQDRVLEQLKADGRPIGVVNYVGGLSSFLPYWEHWAGLTGGSAIDGEAGFLGKEIVALAKDVAARAPLSDCPAGQIHDADENCVEPPNTFTFKYEPRISCSRGCRVVQVKITFDSDGNVVAESIPEEEGKISAAAISVAGGKAKSNGNGRAKGKGRKKNPCARRKGKGKKAGRGKARGKPKGKARSSARQGKKGKRKGKGKGRKVKCKTPRLIRKLEQAVVAGENTLSLKLTGAAIRQLKEKGKLPIKVTLTFTPNGGLNPNVLTHTFRVIKPKPKKRKRGKRGKRGKKGKGKARGKSKQR